MGMDTLIIEMGNINYDKLPFDCPAKASQRLNNFWYNNFGIFSETYSQKDYSRDIRVILGDPCKAMSIQANKEGSTKALHKRCILV